MASRNLTTRTTIQNLTAELRTKFTAINTALGKTFQGVEYKDNTIKFYAEKKDSYTAADTALATINLPADMVLDIAKTKLVDNFAWGTGSEYPGGSNPNLEGKPVLVMAVKQSDGVSYSYSFMDMTKLLNIYTAKANGKDGSTTVTISGYEIEVVVNISTDQDNILKTDASGKLKVSKTDVGSAVSAEIEKKIEKVDEPTAGNVPKLTEDGSLEDSDLAVADIMKKAKPTTNNNLAALDTNGQVVDSGVAKTEVMTKPTSPTEGNVVKFGPTGNAVDTGIAADKLVTKVQSATADNLATLDANGALTDSGIKKADVVVASDIQDYSAEDIQKLLNGETPASDATSST